MAKQGLNGADACAAPDRPPHSERAVPNGVRVLIRASNATRPRPAPATARRCRRAAGRCRATGLAQSRLAAVEPGEAVEDEVECERELGVVVAPAEGTAVGDREGHLHDVGVAGAECAGEGGGSLRLEPAGIVEEGGREPEQVAAEDV